MRAKPKKRTAKNGTTAGIHYEDLTNVEMAESGLALAKQELKRVKLLRTFRGLAAVHRRDLANLDAEIEKLAEETTTGKRRVRTEEEPPFDDEDAN